MPLSVFILLAIKLRRLGCYVQTEPLSGMVRTIRLSQAASGYGRLHQLNRLDFANKCMWYFGLIQHFYIAHILSCSPANFLNINVSIVSRVLKMSQEKLKKIHAHFSFSYFFWRGVR